MDPEDLMYQPVGWIKNENLASNKYWAPVASNHEHWKSLGANLDPKTGKYVFSSAVTGKKLAFKTDTGKYTGEPSSVTKIKAAPLGTIFRYWWHTSQSSQNEVQFHAKLTEDKMVELVTSADNEYSIGVLGPFDHFAVIKPAPLEAVGRLNKIIVKRYPELYATNSFGGGNEYHTAIADLVHNPWPHNGLQDQANYWMKNSYLTSHEKDREKFVVYIKALGLKA